MLQWRICRQHVNGRQASASLYRPDTREHIYGKSACDSATFTFTKLMAQYYNAVLVTRVG